MLAALAVLAVVLKASPASLSLRWPARRWVRWAVVGFVVAGPLALLAGPYLAQPFFGDVGIAWWPRRSCRRSCSRSRTG